MSMLFVQLRIAIWDPDPDRSNQDLIDDRMIDSEI
jgi:hypothetical protein